MKYSERTKLLTGSGMGATGNRNLGADEINDFIMNLIQITVRDEEGNNIFTKDDLKELDKKNSEVIDRIATVATNLSGLGAGGRAKVKDRFPKR